MAPRYGDRASSRCAKLILLKRSHASEKRIACIKLRIPHKFPKSAVILGRSGLGNYIDDAAHSATIRCIVVVGLNLEFLDGVDN